MKIVFNDATEISVQSVIEKDGQLMIKAAAADLDNLRTKFSDKLATKKMEIIERGQTIAIYEDYTVLYRLEEYTGKIYGVVMYQEQQTPEIQTEMQARGYRSGTDPGTVPDGRAGVQCAGDLSGVEIREELYCQVQGEL